MSSSVKSKNDVAWEQLFSKYDIVNKVDAHGQFEISAKQIKEFREPRLMAKFDHTVNLPKIFSENKLSILPVTRGDYVIANFDSYYKFETHNVPVTKVSLPEYIQSLDYNNITSETIALNSAMASGIITDFLQDEDLVSTVSGRMGSGVFSYNIKNTKAAAPYLIEVNNSQIEIDAAYEGIRYLALFEAKRDLSEDFLIRQLYYPFRMWKNRITKPVKPIFLVYSNGIYRLYEYEFQDINNYNSLTLIKQKYYSIEDTVIGIIDIQRVLEQTNIVPEPKIPFSQANSFERVINICELLNEKELSRNDVTERYAFNVRQTNYYTDAARYLGLIEKKKEGISTNYILTTKGRNILKLDFKSRQLEYCKLILSHKVFKETLRQYFKIGQMPSYSKIVAIMKQANLYNLSSESTFLRRASTIKSWVNWIIGLINE